MEKVIEKEFKVGDKIVVTPRYGAKYTLTVTRLTKLHAVCETKNLMGTKISFKFKKNWRKNGNYFSVRPVPVPDWITTTYEVIES